MPSVILHERGFGWVAAALLIVSVQPLAAGAASEPRLPEAKAENDSGFKPIFDGQTLKGWDGDPQYWRVENGAIVGETTEKNIPKENSFIIWRGGTPGDFELKLEYRVSALGNSAVQYRSSEVPDAKWALRGSQFDIDGAEWGKVFHERFAKPRGWDLKRVTGQNYEERGRTFLALPGQLTYIAPGEPQREVASFGAPEALAEVISDEWNRVHLIVRGNQMIHILNDRVISVVIDDDKNRRTKGYLGMQVHAGPPLPMKVEFRNIRLKAH